MRLLVAALAVVLTALSATPHDAEARLRLVTKEVRWVNTNRLGCAGVDGCVGRDTALAGLSSTKNDTTVILNVEDLVPIGLHGSIGQPDSLHELARFTIVSDSAAAGTVTAVTMTVDAVYPSSIASEWESNVPGISVHSIAATPATGSRIISLPITIGAHQVGGALTATSPASGTRRSLMHGNWRIALSSVTGTAGRLRAYLSYYVED